MAQTHALKLQLVKSRERFLSFKDDISCCVAELQTLLMKQEEEETKDISPRVHFDVKEVIKDVKGFVPDCAAGHFTAKMLGDDKIRIEHTGCAAFWIEFELTFEPINVRLDDVPLEPV
jgi:hypothetical protein